MLFKSKGQFLVAVCSVSGGKLRKIIIVKIDNRDIFSDDGGGYERGMKPQAR